MFNLDYKASNIRYAEKDYNLSFFEAVAKVGSNSINVTSLMFLYACGGATEDDFDKDFKKGMQEVVLNIFKAIDAAGFLGVKLDLKAMEEELKKSENEMTATSSSTKSGKATNA